MAIHKEEPCSSIEPQRLESNFKDTAEAVDEIAEELENAVQLRNGVVHYRFGRFDVFVVYREQFRPRGCDIDLWRYRVYIPSLSLVSGSLGGFNVCCKPFIQPNKITNECFLDGKTSAYLRRSWFANLPLLSNALTGKVPFFDNSQVEISFKNRKHNTDLGILARQRAKGMNLVEYVKRAAVESKTEAVRMSLALTEMAHKTKLVEQNKSKASKSFLSKLLPKKWKTLHSQCTDLDPLNANNEILTGVFTQKKSKAPNKYPYTML